jgi:threonine dehydrogenase-like Zn-dependent dehydrogenase
MQFPDPAPGPHDVVVEIKASGMCGSDLRFYRASGETASLGLGKVSGPADCARFVADRKIAVDHLFTHRWKLDQADEAYRVFDRQTEGKSVFVMQ